MSDDLKGLEEELFGSEIDPDSELGREIREQERQTKEGWPVNSKGGVKYFKTRLPYGLGGKVLGAYVNVKDLRKVVNYYIKRGREFVEPYIWDMTTKLKRVLDEYKDRISGLIFLDPAILDRYDNPITRWIRRYVVAHEQGHHEHLDGSEIAREVYSTPLKEAIAQYITENRVIRVVRHLRGLFGPYKIGVAALEQLMKIYSLNDIVNPPYKDLAARINCDYDRILQGIKPRIDLRGAIPERTYSK